MALRWMIGIGFCCAVACGASKGPSTTEGSSPQVKKASLAWGINSAGGAADVFLAVTDETGRATSHPLGRFEGECTAISGGRPATGAVTALLGRRGDVGVELDAVPRPGVIIVLKMAYAAGAEPDPLSGEEVAHIAVPVGALIETTN
jgi:hypothetical protein